MGLRAGGLRQTLTKRLASYGPPRAMHGRTHPDEEAHMNAKPRWFNSLHAACLVATLALMPGVAFGQSPPTHSLGGLTVHVTRAGAPVANATEIGRAHV